MNTRTWPYGTRCLVEVLTVDRAAVHGMPVDVIACKAIAGLPPEGYILVQTLRATAALYHRPAVGQVRVIEFLCGGSTGGYWSMRDGLREANSGTCRVCGCMDHDCGGCVDRTGRPCHWVEPDLCSACAPAAGGAT